MLDHFILEGRLLESMSDDEFYVFCAENPNMKFEREPNGQIIAMSPTGFNTGDRNSEIITQLRNWNKEHKLGRVSDSDTGFYLPNGAMRNPDAAWISHERLATVHKEELEKIPHLVPDFIIELTSNSDYPRNIHAKMQEWIDNGCRLGWWIDPYKETVTIYRPGKEMKTLSSFDQKISGGEVLPEFELDLAELRIP